MEEIKTKKCKYCGEYKTEQEFYRNAWGYSTCCKECHAKRMAEGRKKKKELKESANDALNARNLRLSDFTPRELFVELKRRGCEFKATYTEIHTIDSKDF